MTTKILWFPKNDKNNKYILHCDSEINNGGNTVN